MVLHGFGQHQEEEKAGEAAKIVSVLLQSIFPPINVHNLNLSQCKRIVLFALSQDQSHDHSANGSMPPLRVEFRHYEIATRQRSVNKAVKKYKVR